MPHAEEPNLHTGTSLTLSMNCNWGGTMVRKPASTMGNRLCTVTKNDTTIFSASCNCGSTNVLSTAAPENLQDHHNRKIGHPVNELVNLFGQSTVWTVRSRLCASTGIRTTCTTCKQGHRSLAEQLEKLCGPKSGPWESASVPRLEICTTCITGH